MTVVDMHHNFLLKIKTLDRTDIKDPLSYDVVSLLNQAQNDIVDQLILTQQWTDLRPVIESIPVDETAGGSYTGNWDETYVTGINNDGDSTNVPLRAVNLHTLATSSNTSFRNYVRSQSKITRTQSPLISGETFVQNEEVPKELIGDFEINGSNYPIFTRPKAFLEGSYLILLGDYYTHIAEAAIVVVRTPKTLDLATNSGALVTTCELPTHVHQQVVDRAVQLFGETVNINDLKKG